ncbi:MAG TPA: hypothetical protein VHW02_07050 [Rhizomicrobium sp.]|nr:hypothetical protein [Rhizomicrobium sp.]
MHKIPMSETVSGAYNFAFKNFLSILGIAWFPYVLVGALLTAGVIEMMPSVADINSDALMGAVAILNLIALGAVAIVLIIVASAMVNVGVMRQALGLHTGQVFIYFSLGAAVWRMIGALLLAVIAIYALIIACVLVIVLVCTAGVHVLGEGLAYTIGTIGGIAAFVFCIYVMVRLTYFIAPVVVAEERIGLGRAWELGKGNFWRIIGLLIAVTLPVGIAFNIIITTLMGTFPVDQVTPNMTPNDFFLLYSHYYTQSLSHMWPVLVIVELAYVVALTGLMNGAQATAYLYVTGKKTVAPPYVPPADVAPPPPGAAPA